MTNHVHLLLTPERGEAAPRLIIALGRRYVQTINKTWRRNGPLWDSHYKSSLIDADHYLLTCQRYIEFNPAGADIVTDPADCRWSSYRSNALGQSNPLLTPHPVHQSLDRLDIQCQSAYRAPFRPHLDAASIDNIRLALNQSQPLGNSRFLAHIEAMTGTRREPRPRGRPDPQTTTDSDQGELGI